MTNKKIIYKPIDPEIEKIVHHHGGASEATLEVLKDLDAENRLNSRHYHGHSAGAAHSGSQSLWHWRPSIPCSLLKSGKISCAFAMDRSAG